MSAAVGAGHDGPADETGRRMTGRGWVAESRDGLGGLPAGLGPLLRDLYIVQMRYVPRSWRHVLGAAGTGASVNGLHRALDRLAGRTLDLIQEHCDVVVSTCPLVSQMLGHLRESGRLSCPVVSFTTDLSARPLWCHPGVDLTLTLHPAAAAEAAAHGAQRVEVCAPALAPRFHTVRGDEDGTRTRRVLGIRADQSMALVTSGAAGTGAVLAAARGTRQRSWWGAGASCATARLRWFRP